MSASRSAAVAAAALVALATAAHAEGPAIDHSEIKCLVAGKYRKMPAKFSPADVAQPRVYFRPEGVPSWYYVEMKPEDPLGHVGVLPKPTKKLVKKHIEYYVEAASTRLRQRAHARVRADRGGEGQGVRPRPAGPALLEEPAGRPSFRRCPRASRSAEAWQSGTVGARRRRRRGGGGRRDTWRPRTTSRAATRHAPPRPPPPSRPCRPPPRCPRRGWASPARRTSAQGRVPLHGEVQRAGERRHRLVRLRLELRRRRHVDAGQPVAHLHGARACTT